MKCLPRKFHGLLSVIMVLSTACTPSPEKTFPSYKQALVELNQGNSLAVPEKERLRFDDPADLYYVSIDSSSSSEELKQQLHDLIDDHKKFSYGQMWEMLAYTDQDLGDPSYVVLLYANWSLHKDNHGSGSDQWTREHVWSKSHGEFKKSHPAYTDAHHLRPSDKTINSARNNRSFAEGGSAYFDGGVETPCKTGEAWTWEPGDDVKGDVARMMFYMVVRYEGPGNGDLYDLELNESIQDQEGKEPTFGVLSQLLKWHKGDPPDDWERRRNWRVYEYQGNRNPFIDHPEWVEQIWDDE